MAAPNRVEELRKRYHENPRRFFAPLANEYRKTGFPDRAILLCEKHLGEQPDNLNGLVVYGQTLFESGRFADAKQPFEMALNLDPENLIALRHLGDIAREGGENDEARRWYERVLEFDRRNEEVLQLLESVGGASVKEPPSGPTSAPSIVSVASSVRVTSSGAADPSALGMIDLDAAPPAVVEPPSAPRPRASTPAVKTVEVSAQAKPAKRGSLLDIAFDFGEVASPAAPPPAPAPAAPLLGTEAAEYGFADTLPVATPASRPQALEDMPTLVTEPVAPRAPTPAATPIIEMPPAPVELGSVGRIEGLEAAEFSADVEPIGGLEPSEFQSGDVAPLMDLEAGAFTGLGADEHESATLPPAPPEAEMELPELPSVDEEADLGGTIAFSASGLEALGPPPAPRPTDGLPLLDLDAEPARAPEPEREPEPMPLPRPEPEPVAERAAPPKPFVTETMAELYLKQGHRDQAMDVYRQLIEQSPGDESLRAKLAKLEAVGRASLEFDVPVDAEIEEPTPAPANSMLADVSFADVALSTPTPTRPMRLPTPPRGPAPTPPAPKPAVPAGPSAREYLAAFARRGFTPLSSPVIPAPGAPAETSAPMSSALPGGGLDLVFGSEVSAEDERAAHRLAGVGATSGPSGGSALDSLFGEGPSAPMPAAPPSGRPGVQRASDKLRFDQFFTTPAADAAPVVEEPSVSEEAIAESPSVEAASVEPPPEDDDLDQFQGWLRGLTQ